MAVTEVLALELLLLEDDLLELLETLVEDATDDFAWIEVVLTIDILVLDVLVAELRMH